MWASLLCWLACLCAYWAVRPVPDDLSIRCLPAVTTATLAVVGYAACRAMTEVVSAAEKVWTNKE